jgi:transmembrane sensor
MPASRLEDLFDRYVNYRCTAEEVAELMSLLALPENEDAVQRLVVALMENTGPERQMPDLAAANVLRNILQKEEAVVHPIGKKSFPWWRAAAVAILFIAGAAYWGLYKKKDSGRGTFASAVKQAPVLPGSDRALLTMADGSVVVLDSLKNQPLQQGGAKINNQTGLLTYQAPTSSYAGSGVPVVYNTVSTPRGGQYQIVLADGTKVWLNAASSLHFPTAFTGGQREVQLTGEAYFEVAKDKEKPFRVMTGDMRINVLGTNFNVNAYADEAAIRTSLLEGSVRIMQGSATSLLQPGQQAILDKGTSSVKIAGADMNEVIAWKNGLFQFEGADITSIMRQIGRWYDVEIVFAGKIPAKRFNGKISRKAELSDVLQILELSNVKFSIEGKKIVVQ